MMLLICSILLCIHAAVEKVNGYEPCLQRQSGLVRLAGLNSTYVGYVQLCRHGYWTSVGFEDEEEWTKKNSIVTCRELGFLGAVRVLNNDWSDAHPSQTTSEESNLISPWQYYSVECTGMEGRLKDCSWSIKSIKTKKRDAIALCKEVPINGEVVLIGVNGQDNEGIVEIYSPVKTYRWSPLCTSEWDDIDAQVVCRQLGFKGGSSKYYSSEQENYSLLPRKRYNHFKCEGNELQLTDCQYSGPYPYKCYGEHYAGVVCTGESENNILLKLNIAILALMIVISLLLIVMLLVVLRCTLQRFRKKPSNRSQVNENRTCQNSNRQINFTRTELDHDMPYALLPIIAPPSYEDTLVADQMIIAAATSEDEEGESPSRLTVEAEDSEIGSSTTLDSLLLNEDETQNITTESIA